MTASRPEPQPKNEAERAALLNACPYCFAHPGSWCASPAARDDYLLELHAGRFNGVSR